MRRVYVVACEDLENTGERTTPVEVFFTYKLEEAFSCRTREQSQNWCRTFDSWAIKVNWVETGEYVCQGFQAEERSPNDFVVFCDGPFTLKAVGTKVAERANA